MLRLMRRLLGLWKVDRNEAQEPKPEVFKRLQVSCVYAVMHHEKKSGMVRLSS